MKLTFLELIKIFFYKINKSLFYYKYNFKRSIRILFKIDQKIYIQTKKIILPPGHLLTLYDSLYPEYDKFLPNKVKDFKDNESIIDIGANVGDTLVGLLGKNSKPNYHCIEADDYFFKYLKKNKDSLDLNLQKKIFLIKELVGNNLIGNLSESTTGTKSFVPLNTGTRSKKLDEIILEHKIENIKLIKVDVDGYDYDVLFSGINEITKNKPDLFFEYMIINEACYKGYIEFIDKLYKIGYSNWTLLNNYGSIIFQDKSYIDILKFTKSTTKHNIVFDIYCNFEK